jgi:plasmid maintenance system antidote protein VapI
MITANRPFCKLLQEAMSENKKITYKSLAKETGLHIGHIKELVAGDALPTIHQEVIVESAIKKMNDK